jgi:hypothetical protein
MLDAVLLERVAQQAKHVFPLTEDQGLFAILQPFEGADEGYNLGAACHARNAQKRQSQNETKRLGLGPRLHYRLLTLCPAAY